MPEQGGGGAQRERRFCSVASFTPLCSDPIFLQLPLGIVLHVALHGLQHVCVAELVCVVRVVVDGRVVLQGFWQHVRQQLCECELLSLAPGLAWLSKHLRGAPRRRWAVVICFSRRFRSKPWGERRCHPTSHAYLRPFPHARSSTLLRRARTMSPLPPLLPLPPSTR